MALPKGEFSFFEFVFFFLNVPPPKRFFAQQSEQGKVYLALTQNSTPLHWFCHVTFVFI